MNVLSGYVLSNAWYTSYDISSNYTKTTVIDGCVVILFITLWAALGIYANKLAYRLVLIIIFTIIYKQLALCFFSDDFNEH